jgi:hypothetical protein
MDTYTWSKKLFYNSYTLFRDSEEVGVMKGNPLWSKTSQARLLDNEHTFVSENWKSNKVKIYKKEQPVPIADIKCNSFKSKAEIIYCSEIYELKFLDIWYSNWQISKSGNRIIKTKNSSLSGGEADINEDNRELLLIALYASNYFFTIGFLFIIIVVVIVISN